MSEMNSTRSSLLLERAFLARLIRERPRIWQNRFLGASTLANQAKTYGVGFSAEHVEELWGLGLLRADYVISSRQLRRAGFVRLGRTPEGDWFYADERQPKRRRQGWGGLARRVRLRPIPANPVGRRGTSLQALFHPFRHYVLYCLHEELLLPVARMQPFHDLGGYRRLLEDWLVHFQRSTGEPSFLRRIERWNRIVALAVAAEPCAHEVITGTVRYPASESSPTQQRRRIAHHERNVARQFRRIGMRALEDIREELCRHMLRLDPNRDLQTLIRLSHGFNRLTPEGRLGGAMVLRTMAESIRRVVEHTFDAQLPEEDEVGSTSLYRKGKVESYGASRLLDGGRDAADSFLTHYQLKRGRVHWYVEGATECGAIQKALGQEPGIVVTNLRGQVAAKRGKGVAFQDDLASDMRAKVYSIVSLDGDVDENRRALQVSVKREQFFGWAYVAKPDFELANFSMDELRRIVWRIALKNRAPRKLRPRLASALADAVSVDDLMSRGGSALPEYLARLKKGAEWGGHLIEYAWDHPTFSRGPSKGEKRPIIKAIDTALGALASNYSLTSRRHQVQPMFEAGELISVELVRKQRAGRSSG